MPRFDLVRHWPVLPGLVLVLLLASLSASSLQAGPSRDGNPKDEITWVAMAPMPTARAGVGVAVLNGLIYVAGGSTPRTQGLATLEVFDPVANRWATKANMPTARYMAGLAALGGKLYAIGGSTARGQLNSVEEYDPLTDRWQVRAGLSAARVGLGVAASGGRIYAIGGYDGNTTLDTVEAYDPATNTWTARAPMPTHRSSLAVAVGPNGHIYAAGGYSTPPREPVAAVEEYDPSRNTWVRKTGLPDTRYDHALAALSNGKLYSVAGVPRPMPPRNDVIVYDPATNAWTAASTGLALGRTQLGAAVVDDRLYAIGGSEGTYPVDSVEQGTLAGYAGPAAPPGVDRFLGLDHVACTNADIYFVLGVDTPGAIDYAYYQITVVAKDGAELAEILPLTDAGPAASLAGLGDALLIDLAAGSLSITPSGTIVDLTRTLLDRISKLKQSHIPPSPLSVTWHHTARSAGVRFLIHATRSGAGTVTTSARWQRNANDAINSSWATPVCYATTPP